MLNLRFLHICNHPFYISPATWPLGLLSNLQQCRYKQIQALNHGQVKLLMEVFGCAYDKTYKIMNKYSILRTMDQDHIRKVADALHRFGITKTDLTKNPKVLCLPLGTIQNHVMLLQEGGFTNVTGSLLISHLSVMRKPVRLLKAHGYIPSEVNLAESFFSHLAESPPPFESINSEDVSDDKAFIDVQVNILKHYLMWRLEMTSETFNFILKTYSHIKHKSFRNIERALKILEDEVGLSKEKIQRHGYLIHSNPDNILDTLQRVKTLGGQDIRDVFKKYPKVIVSPVDSILKTAQYLQEFKVPDSAVQKCPEIFTLNSETVLKRLRALRSVPEFSALAKHPRVVELLVAQRKAYTRLSYLQEMKMKCVSLHLLATTQTKFDRYVREGGDKTKGNDVLHFLSLELHEDEKLIRKMLRRHPFWCHIPLVSVQETLNFLLMKGFTKQHIVANIQVLLYSRKQLEEELQLLPSRPELNTQIWTSQPTPVSETKDNMKPRWIPHEQYLALCLYFIERDYHFTGDGIWGESAISSVRADSSV